MTYPLFVSNVLLTPIRCAPSSLLFGQVRTIPPPRRVRIFLCRRRHHRRRSGPMPGRASPSIRPPGSSRSQRVRVSFILPQKSPCPSAGFHGRRSRFPFKSATGPSLETISWKASMPPRCTAFVRSGGWSSMFLPRNVGRTCSGHIHQEKRTSSAFNTLPWFFAPHQLPRVYPGLGCSPGEVRKGRDVPRLIEGPNRHGIGERNGVHMDGELLLCATR